MSQIRFLSTTDGAGTGKTRGVKGAGGGGGGRGASLWSLFLITIMLSALVVFNGCKKAGEEKVPEEKMVGAKEAADPGKEHFNQGVKYSLMGEYDEAIKEYQKTLEYNPNSFETYSNLGFAYFDKGDYDNSIKSQRKAIELNPNYENAYYGLAQALDKTGDRKGALDNWNEFIQRTEPGGKWYAKAKERIKALEEK